MADDTSQSDIWYNIGYVAMALGDVNLALRVSVDKFLKRTLVDKSDGCMFPWIGQCMRLAVTHDGSNGEAFNNLGVIGKSGLGAKQRGFQLDKLFRSSLSVFRHAEQRRNNVEAAHSHYHTAIHVAPHIHEPHYNVALLAAKAGDIDTSYKEVRQG